MKTIVIIGGIILTGATVIAVMMDQRNEAAKPAVSTQGIPALPDQAAENPRVNPAHGQPGHRCDLAVGAPLINTDGTPVPAANPQNIQSAPALPAPVPAGLKVNPPHGQPGHRCDIQVGAPL